MRPLKPQFRFLAKATVYLLAIAAAAWLVQIVAASTSRQPIGDEWRGVLPAQAASLRTSGAQPAESATPGCAPGYGTWSDLTSASRGRSRHGFVYFPSNGKFYALGGETSQGNSNIPIEEYDPATNTWSDKANLLTAVIDAGAVTVGNYIYVPGGFDGAYASAEMQRYDPLTNSVATMAPMPNYNRGHAVASLGTRIYVLGGSAWSFEGSTNYIYDTADNTWITRASVPVAVTGAAAASDGTYVYLIGGRNVTNGVDLDIVQRYDPASNTWSSVPSLETARSGVGVFWDGARLWAVGGGWTGYLASTEYYTPGSGGWTAGPSMNYGVSRTAAAFGGGRAIKAGGESSGGWVGITEALPFSPCATGTVTATPQGTATYTQSSTSSPFPSNTATPYASATNTPVPSATPTATCGLGWETVPSPDYGSEDNFLTGVTAIGSNDAWAVGRYSSGSDTRLSTEHWNGSAWVQVANPSTGRHYEALAAVAGMASNDVWAVGIQGEMEGYGEALIMHWAGSWSLVPAPANSGELYGVSAISSNDVWAVGKAATETQVLHWDGTQWSRVPSPSVGSYSNELDGIAAVASDDIWAVGSSMDGGCCASRTLVEHWNGTAWSLVSSPSPGTYASRLTAVAALASNDVWAVGDQDAGAVHQTLTEHWDGSNWSVISSAGPGATYNFLRGVAAVAPDNIWAVGEYTNGSPYQTLTMHWDGTAWSVVDSPSPGFYNGLEGVAVASPDVVWAAGYQDTGSPAHTLVLRYSGPCPSLTTTPTAGASSPTSTPTLAATDTATAAPGNTSTSTPGVVPSDTASATLTSTASATASATHTYTALPTSTPTAIPTTCAIEYPDVPPGSTFYDFVHCLACRGIISGYPNGTFGPGNPVTRGQLSKIVSNSAGYSETFTTNTFEDVPVGSTFFPYVERLYFHGGIQGYACGNPEPCVPPANKPYFRPGANVTRGQTSKIGAIARQLPAPNPGQQTFEDVQPGSTFWQWIEPLVATGAIQGYQCGGTGEPCLPPNNRPYFRPGANVTRGQSAKIVSNAFFPGCSTPAR